MDMEQKSPDKSKKDHSIVILGPFYLRILSIKNKNFYLFGENHNSLQTFIRSMTRDERENYPKQTNTVFFDVLLDKLYNYFKNKNQCVDYFIEYASTSVYFTDKLQKEQESDAQKYFNDQKNFAKQQKEIHTNYTQKSSIRGYMRYLNEFHSFKYYNEPNIRIHNLEIRDRAHLEFKQQESRVMGVKYKSIKKKYISIFQLLWQEFYDHNALIQYHLPPKNILIKFLFGSDDDISTFRDLEKKKQFMMETTWDANDFLSIPYIDQNEMTQEEKENLTQSNSNYFEIEDCSKIPFPSTTDLPRGRLELICNLINKNDIIKHNEIEVNRILFVETLELVPFTTCENLKVWLKYFFKIEENDNCDQIMQTFINQLNNIHLDRSNNVLPFSIFKSLRDNEIMTMEYFNKTRQTLNKQYINFDGTEEEREIVFNRVAQEYCNQILEWFPIENNGNENTITQLRRMTVFWGHITDIYVFFRIFRNWDREKEWRSVEGCGGDNYKMKNIIAYTGENHSAILGRIISAAFKEEASMSDNDFIIQNPDSDFKVNISKNHQMYTFFQNMLDLHVTIGRKKKKTRRKRKTKKKKRRNKTNKKTKKKTKKRKYKK